MMLKIKFFKGNPDRKYTLYLHNRQQTAEKTDFLEAASYLPLTQADKQISGKTAENEDKNEKNEKFMTEEEEWEG